MSEQAIQVEENPERMLGKKMAELRKLYAEVAACQVAPPAMFLQQFMVRLLKILGANEPPPPALERVARAAAEGKATAMELELAAEMAFVAGYLDTGDTFAKMAGEQRKHEAGHHGPNGVAAAPPSGDGTPPPAEGGNGTGGNGTPPPTA